MTIEELEKKVVELEAEIARLRAGAFYPQTIYHYHYGAPQYVPQPTWGQPPCYPQIVYCGPTHGGGSAIG